MKSNERHTKIKNTSVVLSVIVFSCSLLCTVCSPIDEELEVRLEFNEYDLEDNCIEKNDAQWLYVTGRETSWNAVRDIELKNAEYDRNEAKILQEQAGRKFYSKKLQRLAELFLHPGPSLLSEEELKQVLDFSYNVKKFKSSKSKLSCKSEDICEKLNEDVEQVLQKEKRIDKLKQLWINWFVTLENATQIKQNIVGHLKLLQREVELNNASNLASYWLETSEVTNVNYEGALELWKQLTPLYTKLRRFVAVDIAKKYGREMIANSLLPAHLLGTLEAEEWLRTSEKFEMIYYSETNQNVQNSLKKLTISDIYKIADNLTNDLNFGRLPEKFYKDSMFKCTSENCEHWITDYCKKVYPVRISYRENDTLNWEQLLTASQNVMRYKITNMAGVEQEMENGFLMREGVRDSVTYEAVINLATTLATQGFSLRRSKLIPEETSSTKDETVTHQLVTALNLLPKLPYYLLADIWRIKTLQEINKRPALTTTVGTSSTTSTTEADWYADFNLWTTKSSTASEGYDEYNYSEESVPEVTPEYNVTEATVVREELKPFDVENVTQEWWNLRAKLVGISPPDEGSYADYLMDEKILRNRPYISQFLGAILQFQILEFLQNGNLTVNSMKLQSLIKCGKSEPWEKLLEEHLNIKSISVESLLNYFKPLEEFLDSGGKFDSLGGNRKPFQNNLQELLKNYASTKAPVTDKPEEEETDNAFTTIAICILLGGCAVLFLVILIRRSRAKKKSLERKKKLKQLSSSWSS